MKGSTDQSKGRNKKTTKIEHKNSKNMHNIVLYTPPFAMQQYLMCTMMTSLQKKVAVVTTVYTIEK